MGEPDFVIYYYKGGPTVHIHKILKSEIIDIYYSLKLGLKRGLV